jgi:hypothetical protein
MMKDSKDQLGFFSVVTDESGRELWVEIGYATPQHDGEGFDLTLRALPLASRLVLREVVPDDSEVEFRDDKSSQEDLQAEPRERTRERAQERIQEPTQELATLSLASQVRDFERAVIRQCLLETGGNIGAVLERLKIPRRTLNEKMVRLGIDRRRLKALHRPRIAAKAETGSPEPERTVVHGESALFLEQPGWSKNGASNGQ